MESYLVKHREPDSRGIVEFVEKNGGLVEFSSPILPILGISIESQYENDLNTLYNLEYIRESSIGKIMTTGSLNGIQRNSVRLLPSLDFSLLRNQGYTGWGSTIAVLDSGVSEPWIQEHFDYTGYGSTPLLDHGTKVANIIKTAAPGARVLSFKVTQDGNVRDIDLLMAIVDAVEKVDILNISIGFTHQCSQNNPCSLCEHVNYYTQNMDKLFVVAAGNLGSEKSVQCPGNSQEAITVGAVKSYSNNELADYSSRGVAGIKKPNILTSGSIYFNQDPDQGTSFATPVIAGVSGALSHFVNKSVSKTKDLLYASTKDIGIPDYHQGFGLLSLEKLTEVLSNDQSENQTKGQEQS